MIRSDQGAFTRQTSTFLAAAIRGHSGDSSGLWTADVERLRPGAGTGAFGMILSESESAVTTGLGEGDVPVLGQSDRSVAKLEGAPSRARGSQEGTPFALVSLVLGVLAGLQLSSTINEFVTEA